MKKQILLFAAISSLCFLSKISYTQCLNSETEFKNYFDKNINTLDPIEGSWSSSGTMSVYINGVLTNKQSDAQYYDALAIIKNGNKFIQCRLDGQVMEMKIEFTPTAANGVYIFKRTYPDGNIEKANAVIKGGAVLEFSIEANKDEMKKILGKSYTEGMSATYDLIFIKTYPNEQSYEKTQKSSGTGFAISSTGYIATCNHVIDGATSLKIKGIGGDFTKSYTATIISTDVNNDLAIIKIDDASFSTLGNIPYTISSTTNDVGSNIFILGYPLTATMGDEIKLTDGIISAKSGFKGDITSYQISAAAQPGNSGGPLFDKNGNLIGVVNAKHVEAENATYAVKSTYLKNFIDALPTTIDWNLCRTVLV
jgi:S1-C subfamily serine protease